MCKNSHFSLSARNATAVIQICIRLDGLPLVIELAAARIKVFPSSSLLERLSSRLDLLKAKDRRFPARHQTLRQTIAWNHSLLESQEKKLFRRLSVFIGGGSLEAIREFAKESLEKSGEKDVIKEAHTEYYLQLAEAAHTHLTGHEQRHWLNLLERENANLQKGIKWCKATGKITWAYRFGIVLWRFWLSKNLLLEGKETVEEILELQLPEQYLALKAAVKSAF